MIRSSAEKFSSNRKATSAEGDGAQVSTISEFGRFARILGTAFVVFLLLFFVDIVAGLAALTLGSFYAIAVLFGVRGVETWGIRARTFVVRSVTAVANLVKSGYRAVRREVRKRLED